MARRAIPIILTEPDQQELERWVNAHKTPQQVAQRCRIILATAKGQQDKEVARSMGINYKTVALWRQRFLSEGPDCLWEVAAGRGRKPRLTPDKIEEIIHATLQTTPSAATQWSCRTMAEKQGVSKATVNRIWHAATSNGSLQALAGPQILGETHRCRGPLSQSSRESTRALCG